MKRLALALLGVIALVACTDEVPGQTGPGGAPTPRPSSPVTIDNMSGQWVFGERNEPPAGPVVACQAGQIMNVNHQNGELSGGVSRCAGPCTLIETFTGESASGIITLTGQFKGNMDDAPTRVTYTLRYDPATQHLVGTRSGVKFWAAPLVQPEDGSCDGRVY